MILAADKLPDNTGYVAAAYIVLFVLVLIYLAIMIAKLARLEREVVELNEIVDEKARRRAEAQKEHVAS